MEESKRRDLQRRAAVPGLIRVGEQQQQFF